MPSWRPLTGTSLARLAWPRGHGVRTGELDLAKRRHAWAVRSEGRRNGPWRSRNSGHATTRYRDDHPQAAARLALEFRQGGLGGLELRERALVSLHEHCARVGERERARGAHDKLHAELLLELGDLAAHVGLRHADRPRRAPKAAVLHDANEHPGSGKIDASHARDSVSQRGALVPPSAPTHRASTSPSRDVSPTWSTPCRSPS
jgi:hypothetical protein